MAQPLVPRPSGRTPAGTGGEQRAPGRIDYVPTDAVGFEHMPAAVMDALGGVLIGMPIAADADRPVTKRQADGTYYQQATGWWAGEDRYVTIDARRLLSPTEGKKFKPVSGWKIDGTVCHFQPGVVPYYSQWRYDAGSSGSTGPAKRPRAEKALDALPSELTAPVRDADGSAWRRFSQGSAEETIVVSLAAPARVRVLKAQRKATSRRALESADWHAVTVDAPIVWVQVLSTDSDGRVALSAALRPPSLPPGPASDSLT